MKMPATSRVLQIACVCALVALALICWSLFDPRPVPVILAMSLGQIIGTMSFVAFLYVVALDVRKPKTPTPSVRGDAGDHRVE